MAQLQMRRLIRFVFFALVAGVALGAAPLAPDAGGDAGSGAIAPLKVLFIGNSYTYFNHLPALVAAFGETKGQAIQAQMHVVAGATLQQHWLEGRARKVLLGSRFDWVVLQGQSREPIKSWDSFAKYATLFDAEARKTGARTLLFSTWARDGKTEDQRQLSLGYARVAKAIGATVAPVGLAWQKALSRPGAPPLTLKDGAHPAPAGSYLAAAVLFSSLTGLSPLKGPLRIEGKPVHRDGRVFDNTFAAAMTVSASKVVLVDLSPAEGNLLQEAAVEATTAVVPEEGAAVVGPASQRR